MRGVLRYLLYILPYITHVGVGVFYSLCRLY
jgi:hypothetical protein